MLNRSTVSPPSARTAPERLECFQARWRRIHHTLQTAADAAPTSTPVEAREIVTLMLALGDEPIRSRTTHSLLLRAALLAEEMRNAEARAHQTDDHGQSPERATHRQRVLHLHQSLINALDNFSTPNMAAVAEALGALQDRSRSSGNARDAEWTELHCDALARQLVRVLGTHAPCWLRQHTKT